MSRNGMTPDKIPTVYMLASGRQATLYVGVTSNLHNRMAQHDQGLVEGFTKRHGIKHLVYYETHRTMPDAIRREKRLKRWNGAWKYRLIEQMNPEWKNLFDPATGEITPGPSEAFRLENDPDEARDQVGSPPARG